MTDRGLNIDIQRIRDLDSSELYYLREPFYENEGYEQPSVSPTGAAGLVAALGGALPMGVV